MSKLKSFIFNGVSHVGSNNLVVKPNVRYIHLGASSAAYSANWKFAELLYWQEAFPPNECLLISNEINKKYKVYDN